MISPKEIDMTPITIPVKRSITGSLETKGSRKPKKLILSPPDPLDKPELRSLRGTSFEDLYYEVYTQWKGNIPGDLSKEKGNTQNHSRASNIIDAMNWFRTKKEKQILKSAGNEKIKKLISHNLSNCMVHAISLKYIELKIKKKPQTLNMKPINNYCSIPCIAYEDYKKAATIIEIMAEEFKILGTYKNGRL